MEENKSKKSVGVPLILVIAILVIALVGCVTYIMKNNEQELAINNNNSEKTINELRTEITNLKNTLQNKTMSADEKFSIYAKGLKLSLSKFSDFGEVFDGKKFQAEIPVDCDIEKGWLGIEKLELRYNGELQVKLVAADNSDLKKKYGDNYKLASNIIKAGAMMIGQDASVLIYAVNESGEFLYCRIGQYESNKLELKKHNSLKNIVEVQRYSNGETYNLLVATDIDGKMHELEIDW